MDSKRLAIRRIALPCILLAFILVFVGVLVKVQLIDGEEYASAVNTAKPWRFRLPSPFMRRAAK